MTVERTRVRKRDRKSFVTRNTPFPHFPSFFPVPGFPISLAFPPTVLLPLQPRWPGQQMRRFRSTEDMLRILIARPDRSACDYASKIRSKIGKDFNREFRGIFILL